MVPNATVDDTATHTNGLNRSTHRNVGASAAPRISRPPHRGRSLLRLMRLRTLDAHHLSDLQPPQIPDRRRSRYQHEDERGQAGGGRAERDVLHDVQPRTARCAAGTTGDTALALPSQPVHDAIQADPARSLHEYQVAVADDRRRALGRLVAGGKRRDSGRRQAASPGTVRQRPARPAPRRRQRHRSPQRRPLGRTPRAVRPSARRAPASHPGWRRAGRNRSRGRSHRGPLAAPSGSSCRCHPRSSRQPARAPARAGAGAGRRRPAPPARPATPETAGPPRRRPSHWQSDRTRAAAFARGRIRPASGWWPPSRAGRGPGPPSPARRPRFRLRTS